MGLICSLMSTSLRQRLDDLATTFATGVLHAIRGASIEDLLAESGGGRRVAARVRGGGASGSGRASVAASGAKSSALRLQMSSAALPEAARTMR